MLLKWKILLPLYLRSVKKYPEKRIEENQVPVVLTSSSNLLRNFSKKGERDESVFQKNHFGNCLECELGRDHNTLMLPVGLQLEYPFHCSLPYFARVHFSIQIEKERQLLIWSTKGPVLQDSWRLIYHIVQKGKRKHSL